MPRQMNIAEYTSLKGEETVRIQTITSLDNSVLIVTGSLWLVVAAVNGNAILVIDNSILAAVLQLLFLSIAILIILITAIKHWENLLQITIISSYIKVFYEYPSKYAKKSSDEGALFWEMVQVKTNLLNNRLLNPFSLMKSFPFRAFFNGSYVVLEITTFILLFVCLWSSGFQQNIKILATVIAVVLMILIIIGVYRLTYFNNFMKVKQQAILRIHISQAIDLGVIDTISRDNDSLEKKINEIAEEILNN